MTDSSIPVLIVEDNLFMQATIEQLISAMPGIEVVGLAENGRASVEKAVQANPKVVLMDIIMPEMDGIEAAHIIKLQLPECRVLIVSGDQEDDAIVAAFAAGADGFCTKATLLENLEIAIRSVASGKTWLDPLIGERVLSNPQTAPALKFTIYGKMGLTAEEIDVFQSLRKCTTEAEIAEALSLSSDETKAHLQSIRQKLTGKSGS